MILKQADLVPLLNAAGRATHLREWAFNEWKLADLQEPAVIKAGKQPLIHSKKGKWLKLTPYGAIASAVVKKKKDKANPKYTAAAELKQKNHYDELVKFEQTINDFAANATQFFGKQVSDSIPQAFTSIYQNAVAAEEDKQLAPAESISKYQSNAEEAIMIATLALNNQPTQKALPVISQPKPANKIMIATAAIGGLAVLGVIIYKLKNK